MNRKNQQILLFLPLLVTSLLPLAASAQSYDPANDVFLSQGFHEESTGIVMSIVFNPWVSVALFVSIVMVLVGIYFRLYKLIAPFGLIASTIVVFRMFSSQLFGTYSLFQAKIIIPLFVLAMSAKLVSDYMQKKRENERELEIKHSQRRKKVGSGYSPSAGLDRFGDAQSGMPAAFESNFKESKSEPVVKLNRSF